MRVYLVVSKPTDSVIFGFLPAAARLGLDVILLTDQPEAHERARADARLLPRPGCMVRLARSDRLLQATPRRPSAGLGPRLTGVVAEPVTIVGQLCTPKDVLARHVTVARLCAGDLVAFGLAGAYAWNISHHGFLMHPQPGFHYVGAG